MIIKTMVLHQNEFLSFILSQSNLRTGRLVKLTGSVTCIERIVSVFVPQPPKVVLWRAEFPQISQQDASSRHSVYRSDTYHEAQHPPGCRVLVAWRLVRRVPAAVSRRARCSGGNRSDGSDGIGSTGCESGIVVEIHGIQASSCRSVLVLCLGRLSIWR